MGELHGVPCDVEQCPYCGGQLLSCHCFGNGLDYVTFESSPGGVNVDLANPNPQDTGPLGKDTLRHLELAKGSMYDDVLKARTGPGALYGLGGNDLLVGGASSDGLDGGIGVDTASYADSVTGVSVDLGEPGKTQDTGAGSDAITDVENLVGSAHADALTGDDGANNIDGGGGTDSIAAKAGTVPTEQRRQWYKKYEEIVARDMPHLTLTNARKFFAVSSRFGGIDEEMDLAFNGNLSMSSVWVK